MKPVRGTYDLYFNEMTLHNEVVKSIEEIVKNFDYGQIKTPIFEQTALFRRSSGESSDIVQKEMYDFEDKGGRSLTLRPELTAGVVRTFISNKIYGERLPQYKFYYYGEAFRYERPQSLRYRQFYQFGVEMFGEDSTCSDVEVIVLAMEIVKGLNLNKNTTLKINTIGTSAERKKYNEQLKEYFQNKKSQLCEDCQVRYELNPLKIMDCKIDSESDIVQQAPKLKDTLSQETKDKYQSILKQLDNLGIKYEEDSSLVRGLDYYNDIVFELEYDYQTEQKTIIAGGRYDTLVEQLGGPQTPAIGFGLGIERIIEALKFEDELLLEDMGKKVDIYYMVLDEECNEEALRSSTIIRTGGLICECSYNNRSYKSQIKLAQKHEASFIVIMEKELLQEGKVKVQNMNNDNKEIVLLEDFENDLLALD